MATRVMERGETQSHAAFEERLSETISFEDLIRRRAHEIWLARGCEPDSDVNNWLEAEKEILQSK